jgi:hypothetical protein
MPLPTSRLVKQSGLAGLLLLTVLTSVARTQDPGDVLSQTKISDTVGGFTGVLDNSDSFGSGVAALGDLDGDTVPDLVVGASNADDRDPQAGAVWVLELLAGGNVKSHVKISDTAGGFLGVLEPNDHFGASVAVLGDVDGDQIPDLAVGASSDDDGAPQAGAVWIVFLNGNGTVKGYQKISATEGMFGVGLTSDDEFGTSVAALGDIDNNGVPDLAVGAARDDHAASQAGAIWTVLLESTGKVKSSQKITTGVGGFLDVLSSNAAFGSALATLGDLFGDGTTELAVGAPGSLGQAGAVWILSLDATGSVVAHTKIGTGAGGLTAVLDAGEDFGAGLAALGDLDGDGVPDLAVGQPGNDASGEATGAVWLLFLTDGGGVKAEVMIAPGTGGFSGVLDGGDAFGASLAALAPAAPGEVLTLAVGSTRDDDGGSNHGAVWLLTLQGPPGIEEPDLPLPFDDAGGSSEGVAGRPTLILKAVEGPGDELTLDPIPVTPRSDKDTVVTSETMDDISGEIDFAQKKDWFSGGQNPIQGQTLDQTGDGTSDVVVASEGSDSFSTLEGTSGAGAADGGTGFGPPVEYMLPFDGAPKSLAVGDFDNDTDPDVVVAGDQGLSVFLNDGLFSGNYVFASFTPVANMTDVITGFVDGDGNVDVIAASGVVTASAAQQDGFVTVLRGLGDGTLQALGTFANGRAVASVLLGDVDHAGGLDVLVSAHSFDDGPSGEPQGTLSVYLGDGLGGFSASPAVWSMEGTSLGTAGYEVPHPDGIHPRYGALADMNDDGWLDAVYTSSDNIAFADGTFAAEQPPVVISILLNDQLGGFDVNPVGTAYVGRGVTPLVADFFTVPGDGSNAPDCILVWNQDTLAGVSGGGTGEGGVILLAAFVGDGTGLLVDASPNQYLSGSVPGDPIIADVDPLTAADGAPLGLDIIVPNLNDNSLSMMLGNGTGKIVDVLTLADVDDLDPETLPPGIWEGGPRGVRTVRLFGDDMLDIITYNRWDDLVGLSDSVASVSIFVGDGLANFTKSQYLPLPGVGEYDLLGADMDSKADLAVTVRDGVGNDALLIYLGTGTGTVATVPIVHDAPAGHELTGGLEANDIDEDGDSDLVTTTVGPSVLDGAPGTGHLLVYRNTAGVLTPELYDLGVSWTEIRSLDVADMTEDLRKDVVIGSSDGRLFLALALAGGTFVNQGTNPTAAAVGGGAVRVADLNGDRNLDIVTSNMVTDGTLDQAFVRALLGAGNATWSVKTMTGQSSTGPTGALRPAVGDMNGDGATDVVLAHGTADTVSIVLNKLSTFASFDAGKDGSGGIAPSLIGKGYTAPGGKVEMSVVGGLGGAPGVLQIGTGLAPGPLLAVQNVLLDFPIQLDGPLGVPGAGKWEILAHMPNELALVGLEIVMQAILVDPEAAGPPAEGLSLSNGLTLTIVQ